jgi:hypothetical protein
MYRHMHPINISSIASHFTWYQIPHDPNLPKPAAASPLGAAAAGPSAARRAAPFKLAAAMSSTPSSNPFGYNP